MKLSSAILTFGAITVAFIVPDQHVFESLAIEEQRLTHYESLKECLKQCLAGDDDDDSHNDVTIIGENPFDNAVNDAADASMAAFECHQSLMGFNSQGWVDDLFETESAQDLHLDGMFDPSDKIPQPEPPNRRPARPLPDPKYPGQTVYDVISGTDYTLKFAELINGYPDLVELLNGTAGQYTVFAPTNAALDRLFAGMPKDKQPSKEEIRKILEYHISPVPYDAYSVFLARTIGTILTEDALGGYNQRLRVGFGFGGLRINFDSRIVTVNAVRLLPFS
jgi:hypothetical protein